MQSINTIKEKRNKLPLLRGVEEQTWTIIVVSFRSAHPQAILPGPCVFVSLFPWQMWVLLFGAVDGVSSSHELLYVSVFLRSFVFTSSCAIPHYKKVPVVPCMVPVKILQEMGEKAKQPVTHSFHSSVSVQWLCTVNKAWFPKVLW